MLLIITAGLELLAVFMFFGKVRGGDLAVAAWLFIPASFVLALANTWVGVTKAEYTVAQELPILIAVFAVPAAVAVIAVRQPART